MIATSKYISKPVVVDASIGLINDTFRRIIGAAGQMKEQKFLTPFRVWQNDSAGKFRNVARKDAPKSRTQINDRP
jgi:hypothetical protein